MNSINNFKTYINIPPSVTPYISALHSKVSTLGITVLANLGIYLYMGLAVAVQFYQGYQCKQHNPFQLDDGLKFVKCAVILKEAKDLKEKDSTANVVPLLEQCQTLLLSIKSDIRGKKEKLICQLAVQFAESNPEKSYELASLLVDHQNLFQIIEKLCKKHPDFDQDRLKTLLVKTLDVYDRFLKGYDKPAPSHLIFYLKTAKISHKWKDIYLKYRSLELAARLINNFKPGLDAFDGFFSIAQCSREVCNEEYVISHLNKAKDALTPHLEPKFYLNCFYLNYFNAYARIAECFNEVGKKEEALSCLEDAKNLLNDPTVSPTKLTLAHLSLARAYLNCKESDKMKATLEAESLLQFIKNGDVPLNIDECKTLGQLITQITSEDKVIPEFENFASGLLNRLDKTWDCVNNSGSINLFLEIAYAYKALGNETKATEVMNQAWDTAWKKIQISPGQSITRTNTLQIFEIIDYLSKTEEGTNKFLPMLDNLELSCIESSTLDGGREVRNLLQFYKKNNLTEKSNLFSDRYIANLIDFNNSFSAINKLVSSFVSNYDVSVEQKKKYLEAAESLLPNLTNSAVYDLATEIIAEAYVKVNSQKSIQMIEQYQNSQGTKHYIEATFTAVVMGTRYVNAMAALGLVMLRIFANSVYGIGK
jgi:tetratricopeptide (TPR) repeat protein